MKVCVFFLFIYGSCFSQIDDELKKAIDIRRDYQFSHVTTNENNNYGLEVLINEIIFLKSGKDYISGIKSQPKTVSDSIFYYLNKGNQEFYNNLNDSGKGADYYIKGIELSKKIGDKKLICHAIRSKLWYQIWFSYGNLFHNEEFLKLYKEHIYSPQEEVIFNFFNGLIQLRKSDYQKEPERLLDIDKLPVYYKSWWYSDLAIYYHKKKQFKKSEELFLKSTNSLSNNSSFIFKLKKAAVYENLVKASLEKNDLSMAAKYLNYATLNNYQNKLFLQNRTYYLYHKAEYFKNIKQWDSAYLYMIDFNALVADLNQRKMIFQVQDLNKKYEISEKENVLLEKENQILIEQQKKKKNRNIALGLGGLLLFGGITFLLIQKNTKRKQLLAEQEKELQTQKLTTVLKEQELISIDAMIEGQEKERQRIANDLHDDLGGLMATVKLHFNALKEKQSPELYDKTNNLLNQAYNKVRAVAHTKNSGVMAKKGLLKAINDMAKTVSASNALHIEVIDHGLEDRLENSLELTIFRIVQELVTNIIKHAKATEATIHITNHDDSLNIMVEDNGKGFDTKKISKTNGMGIHSIDKRIENLGGTVTIESELNKGTTVIIDIPS